MHRVLSCSFTGHRPEKLPWGSRENDPRCKVLKERLMTELQAAYDAGCRHFLSGMARGTDLYFCEGVLHLKALHADVTLEAVIPYPGQADRWDSLEQHRYRALLEQCDYETVIQHQYTSGCLLRRNRYLVDHSSRIIAAYNGQGGGTLYTITYAMKNNLDMVIVDV
ncbi:MAG: hypothetical protein H6Q61_218 [Firmicutes bacterium]|nr:hypothetical protein [Bacillota bacterium]